jgi:hypothetical protein
MLMIAEKLSPQIHNILRQTELTETCYIFCACAGVRLLFSLF